MKKLLGIVVLGLLWCNSSLANNKLPGSIFNLNDCRTPDGILTDYKINTENNTVTLRNRDDQKQDRVPINDLKKIIQNRMEIE